MRNKNRIMAWAGVAVLAGLLAPGTAAAGTIRVDTMPEKKLPPVYFGEGGSAVADKAGKAVRVEFDQEKSANSFVQVAIALKKEIKDPIKSISIKLKGTEGATYTVGLRGGPENGITSYVLAGVPEAEANTFVIDLEEFAKNKGVVWGNNLEANFPIHTVIVGVKPGKAGKAAKGFVEFSEIVIETK